METKYLFARKISIAFTFFTNDRTIQQLKNSGDQKVKVIQPL